MYILIKNKKKIFKKNRRKLLLYILKYVKLIDGLKKLPKTVGEQDS